MLKDRRQPGQRFTDLPPQELSTLLEVSASLASTLDLEQVLQKAIESAVRVLGLETGAIYLIEAARLFLGATTPPLPPDFPGDLRLADLADHPHIHAAVERGTPVYLSDTAEAELSEAERQVVELRGLRSILYIPLFLEETPTGVMIVGSTGSVRTFSEHQLELARTLAYQIALAVANAHLYQSMKRSNEELRRAYDATLEGWARALELRDKETEGHSRRVTDLTVELAQKMGVPVSELLHLRRGVLLHDIGKMGVADHILRKTGPLEEAEWLEMRRHPQYAYDLIYPIAYLRPALDIPYCHHERWDGTGYPRGLHGGQIPLAARIFAVVDVWDALLHDRPYRPAWTLERTLAHLRAESGRHFDPAVVAAFLEMVEG